MITEKLYNEAIGFLHRTAEAIAFPLQKIRSLYLRDHVNEVAIILALIHVVGIIGLVSPRQEIFLQFTPLNLLISCATIFFFHRGLSWSFALGASAIMILGLAIEIIGVNTGFPFGNYRYGEAFGLQILNTPLLIGVNWFIMTYTGAVVVQNLTNSAWINAIICGIMVTSIDFILEPVAIYLNFWTWESSIVPWQNYLTWFLCIVFFSRLLYAITGKINNKMAKWILLIQVIFFVSIYIYTAI